MAGMSCDAIAQLINLMVINNFILEKQKNYSKYVHILSQ